MRKNRIKLVCVACAVPLALLIFLSLTLPFCQKRGTNLASAGAESTNQSKTITFSENTSGIFFTNTIDASLSCPISINVGESVASNLSVATGKSSILLKFNYLGESYDYGVDSFTTPLGNKDVTFEDFVSGAIKAKFKTRVSVSISSTPSDRVSPRYLTYESSTSKPLSINADRDESGQISLSSSFAFEGTIEIVIVGPLTGEATVLGPIDVNSVIGSDILSATIKVNATSAPTADGTLPMVLGLLSNPFFITLAIIVILTVLVAIYFRRR